MAWSDAARAAALEARKHHAKGDIYMAQNRKMRQAQILLSETTRRYKGDSGKLAEAMFHADVAHSRWANSVDPLGATKEYMKAIKMIRAARKTKSSGKESLNFVKGMSANSGRGQAAAGFLRDQRIRGSGRR